MFNLQSKNICSSSVCHDGSIAFLINAKLVKIGFDSFATAREAKKTEEAEKANRWGDEPKYDTKDPVDPDADPQGTNPDNADYGGGSNIHNDTKVSIESDYRKNSESDEGYLVDPEPVPAPGRSALNQISFSVTW